MARIVVKFGGSSVGDPTNYFDEEHLIKIANTIREIKELGNEVVVVISAMAGATRQLKSLCMAMDGVDNTCDDDMVLTTGEQISTGLLCKLLNSQKYKFNAKGFLGWQLPIITDNAYGNATIKKIDTQKLEECLLQGLVAVVAGYQGITEDNQITTLGFDGSDTTAVAIAGALKADVCQFYKDVRGVFTANPRRVPKATKIDRISTQDMYILSSLGARILHPISLKTAMENNLTLKIVPNFIDGETGTIIVNEDSLTDIAGVTYYEHSDNKITISVVGKKITKDDGDRIIKVLNQNKIFAEIINTPFSDMSITVEIGWIDQLNKSLQLIHTLYDFDITDELETMPFKGRSKQIYRDPAIKNDKCREEPDCNS